MAPSKKKINDLNDSDATLNYPMIAEDNLIVEGRHTLVAMELTGHLDESMISAIKDETRIMLEEDGIIPSNWNHGATKTALSDVRILGEDGSLVRHAGLPDAPVGLNAKAAN